MVSPVQAGHALRRPVVPRRLSAESFPLGERARTATGEVPGVAGEVDQAPSGALHGEVVPSCHVEQFVERLRITVAAAGDQQRLGGGQEFTVGGPAAPVEEASGGPHGVGVLGFQHLAPSFVYEIPPGRDLVNVRTRVLVHVVGRVRVGSRSPGRPVWATVMTTLPLLCPVSTYRCASTMRSRG